MLKLLQWLNSQICIAISWWHLCFNRKTSFIKKSVRQLTKSIRYWSHPDKSIRSINYRLIIPVTRAKSIPDSLELLPLHSEYLQTEVVTLICCCETWILYACVRGRVSRSSSSSDQYQSTYHWASHLFMYADFLVGTLLAIIGKQLWIL